MNSKHIRRDGTGLAGRALLHAAAAAVALAGLVNAVHAHAVTRVSVDQGVLRGATEGRVERFLGVPYAKPPLGELRWRSPRAADAWHGERDATAFAPGCPQPATPFGVASVAEDCLYLNVFAPAGTRRGRHPVLVWIHGGGLSLGESHAYDPTDLAADGTVVVTLNYRLGALGFLAHPALVDRPGGPSGNYGWMDQQAALQWVQRNISRFGGNPKNVTVAGQSAGGLSVLAHLVSPGARGLLHKAIVQSGHFALTQTPLADAEAQGEVFAGKAGCGSQTAECLRGLSVEALLASQDFAYIPGVVDGKVLKQSIGSALASGDFNRVPLINGTTRDEQRLFVSLGANVNGGKLFPVQGAPITASNYPHVVATTQGVSDDLAAEILAHYPPGLSQDPSLAFSALATDASFACPALRANQWTSMFVPTFAYEFNDADAPQRFLPPGFPYGATHQSELQYIFGLPTAQVPGTLSQAQQTLALGMRRYWKMFAAVGSPSRVGEVPWPRFDVEGQVLSLTAPQPTIETDFGTRHQCDFWARVESSAGKQR